MKIIIVLDIRLFKNSFGFRANETCLENTYESIEETHILYACLKGDTNRKNFSEMFFYLYFAFVKVLRI